MQTITPAPAHRPRRDPSAARVVKSYRLHPDTAAKIEAEAKRTGESQGQIVDRLAADIGSDSVTADNRNLRAEMARAWKEADYRIGVILDADTIAFLTSRILRKIDGIPAPLLDQIVREALAGILVKFGDASRLSATERGFTASPPATAPKAAGK
jgi:hypothetical protein